MDFTTISTIWYILITVLFMGYFILEGFGYGVGILLPFVSKTDLDRRRVINSIGPVWAGNEVWLITAGGAMFAAFPHWYATLFSGFYVALVLMLFGIIIRGVGLEFRSKGTSRSWRRIWDSLIFIGSVLPALLWGVALTNFILGTPIDESKTFVGSLFDLLHPYCLLGGVLSLGMFVLHGALFLNLKTTDELQDRAKQVAKKFWIIMLGIAVLYLILSHVLTGMTKQQPVFLVVSLVVAALLFVLIGLFLKANRDGFAFIFSTLIIFLGTGFFFFGLHPNVMVSNINEAYNLTIQNVASSSYTLNTMFTITLIFLPIVLAYNVWTYFIFRHRLTKKAELEY